MFLSGFLFSIQGFRAYLCLTVSWEIFQTVNPVSLKAWLWKATDKINYLTRTTFVQMYFQQGSRKYYGRKTKKAAVKGQRHYKMVRCARKHQFTHLLVKGYNKMPHDNAEKVRNSEYFVPTIFLDAVQAHKQFDQDFPAEEREHGFMVSCKGAILYWDTPKKNRYCIDCVTK